MQIFYVNIGGGEPTVRPDFWELLDYAVEHHVGREVLHQRVPDHPRASAEDRGDTDYVDVQISLDGATAEVNDAVRGEGTYDAALRAMGHLQDAGMRDFKMSVVCTRHNIGQLDEFKAIADRFGAQLRLTRLRPSGRGADVWDELHPLPEQQRQLYDWLVAHGEGVLTGDSFFHLSAYGRRAARAEPLRRRTRRLPRRPDRRRVRVPVRHPRHVPRGRRSGTAGSATCGATPRSSPSCAPRRPAARARSARRTTPAGAAAWRRSSSPVCRSTDRTPSA